MLKRCLITLVHIIINEWFLSYALTLFFKNLYISYLILHFYDIPMTDSRVTEIIHADNFIIYGKEWITVLVVAVVVVRFHIHFMRRHKSKITNFHSYGNFHHFCFVIIWSKTCYYSHWILAKFWKRYVIKKLKWIMLFRMVLFDKRNDQNLYINSISILGNEIYFWCLYMFWHMLHQIF